MSGRHASRALGAALLPLALVIPTPPGPGAHLTEAPVSEPQVAEPQVVYNVSLDAVGTPDTIGVFNRLASLDAAAYYLFYRDPAAAKEAANVTPWDIDVQGRAAPTHTADGTQTQTAALTDQTRTDDEADGMIGPASDDAAEGMIGPVTRQGFPKWTGAIERTWARDAANDHLCADRLGQACRLGPWRRFLDGLTGETALTQIERVNRYVNDTRYRIDDAVWGESDYWAAPGEFFAAGGDCEDYAIAKYYSLKALGFPVEDLRIVVLENMRAEDMHALLAVRVAGRDLLLDNLSETVVGWDQAKHYRPIYSVNEATYWLHRFSDLT